LRRAWGELVRSFLKNKVKPKGLEGAALVYRVQFSVRPKKKKKGKEREKKKEREGERARARGVVQVVEQLASNHGVLSSNPSTTKKNLFFLTKEEKSLY
jgi:hypothetical protein